MNEDVSPPSRDGKDNARESGEIQNDKPSTEIGTDKIPSRKVKGKIIFRRDSYRLITDDEGLTITHRSFELTEIDGLTVPLVSDPMPGSPRPIIDRSR